MAKLLQLQATNYCSPGPVGDGCLRINENVRGQPTTDDGGPHECSNVPKAVCGSSNGSAAAVNSARNNIIKTSIVLKHDFSIHALTFRLAVFGHAMIKLCLDGSARGVELALLHNPSAIHLSTIHVC